MWGCQWNWVETAELIVKCSGLYSAQIQPNAEKLVGKHLSEQTDNDLTTKETQESLSIQEIFFNSQVSPLILTQ